MGPATTISCCLQKLKYMELYFHPADVDVDNSTNQPTKTNNEKYIHYLCLFYLCAWLGHCNIVCVWCVHC